MISPLELERLNPEERRRLLASAKKAQLRRATEARAAIEPADRASPLPLSLSQQRLWFLARFDASASLAYHMPLSLRLDGVLNRVALQAALDRIVTRHEILRTRFVSNGGEALQCIAAVDTGFTLRDRDLSELQGEAREITIRRLGAEEINAPFDLTEGPLVRGLLLRLEDATHILLITLHHIVCDRWSMGVLIDELAALYAAFCRGEADPLPALSIQYADYATWQRRQWQADRLQDQIEFWRQHLAGVPALLELPTDRPRPPLQNYSGASIEVPLGVQLTHDLKSLSSRHDVTSFMTVLASWAILLSRLSGQEDVVIGVPFAGRSCAQTTKLIGFFVNTHALRVRVTEDLTVAQLLQQIKATLLDADAHQDVPFERVVEALKPMRNSSHHPVFQTVVNFNTASGHRELKLPQLTVNPAPTLQNTTPFDLMLSVNETGTEVIAAVHYVIALFDASTIGRYIECWRRLLRSMAEDELRPISAIDILPPVERQRVLETFNAPPTRYPQDKSLHEVFEAQATWTPNATAITYEDQSLSYAELNIKANQLAHYLKENGVGPQRLVGICIERSLEMVVGLLGILKAGGAYVPLDPNHPQERLRYVLKDSAPAILLTQGALRERLPEIPVPVVTIDETWNDIATRPTINPDTSAPDRNSTNLAYVIYTSGSTGHPKGVMVEHRHVLRLFSATAPWLGFHEHDVWTLFHSCAFDFSVWELWGALLHGGQLIVVPYSTTRSPQAFYRLICEKGVTVLNQTPSAFAQLSEAQRRAPEERHVLRTVIFGGEALELRALQAWTQRNGATQPQLVNMYGITETTVHVTYCPLTAEQIESERGRLIGRPVPDLRLYILDRHKHPVPIGVTGEIYVSGDGVSRGYLNHPEWTAARFLPDPFSAVPCMRMYQTGDLGRWREDGTIEYLGRNDRQLKIRGFRIEPAEIEAQLIRHEGIKDAAVIAREEVAGERQLVAYVTLVDSHLQPSVEALRTRLSAALPHHMVPNAFVMLDELPLTANGKLDHQALPPPRLDAYTGEPYEAPVGEVEQTLADLWQELLRVEQVSRHDNFFELGGHSLMVGTLIERLRALGLQADVHAVFTSSTLAALAGTVTHNRSRSDVRPPPANLIPADCTTITPELLPLVDITQEEINAVVAEIVDGASNVQDIYPLSPLQEGILFHHLIKSQGDVYALRCLLSFDSRSRLHDFLAALQTVIDRHDILRSSIHWAGLRQPVQAVWRQAPLLLKEIMLSSEGGGLVEFQQRTEPYFSGLNLHRAPLITAHIAADPHSEEWYLALIYHHLVCDHLTLELIINEIQLRLCGQTTLPPAVPYRHFIARSLSVPAGEHENYFCKLLADIETPTAPFGLLNVLDGNEQVHEVRTVLTTQQSRRITNIARQLGVAVAALFHVAWARIVAQCSGRNDVVFGTVLSGRLQSSEGAHRVVGMFINTLPVRIQINRRAVAQVALETHQQLSELLTHENASLTLAQRCSSVPATLPLFTSLLNYRHNDNSASRQEGSVMPALWEGITILGSDERTNYPLILSVEEVGEVFELTAQCACGIDPDRIVTYMDKAMQELTDALQENPGKPIDEITILSDPERHQILTLFNDTATGHSDNLCVHDLFARQVSQTPEAVALIHGDARLTYAELDDKANRLAQHLIGKGLRPDQLAALYVERGLQMIVGLLGILKAGGAYVPLDPRYPPERLRYMLQDSSPRVVLTQAQLRASLPVTEAEVVLLDEEFETSVGQPQHHPATEALNPIGHQLVYVIYTSGSTGRPKGIAMEHRSLVNLLEWHRKTFGAQTGKRVLQFASLSFDVAFQEIFSTLCTGGTLVIPDEWMRKDVRSLSELVVHKSLQRLFLPPSMLQSLAEYCTAARILPHSLEDIVTAGEPLRIGPEIVRFFQSLPECRLHNHYGPTETHLVTALTLHGDPAQWPSLPAIGRPIANTQVYILDDQANLLPKGATGEICIGGIAVAREYLRRPELTAQRFIKDPFNPDATAVLYKTGDRGLWRPDGTLEYRGRNDEQIKIRGYRIEPKEIEVQLLQHKQIKDAAVMAVEAAAGEKRLVAYIVPREPNNVDAEQLRTHLRNALPEHMIPSAFLMLERLPSGPNGKLDRRALPAPDTSAYTNLHDEPPQGDLEQTVAALWQALLRVEHVGRHDNFFEIGGHSLLAVQFALRIAHFVDIDLPLKAMFDHPTVQALAAHIETMVWVKQTSSKPVDSAMDRECVTL